MILRYFIFSISFIIVLQLPLFEKDFTVLQNNVLSLTKEGVSLLKNFLSFLLQRLLQ